MELEFSCKFIIPEKLGSQLQESGQIRLRATSMELRGVSTRRRILPVEDLGEISSEKFYRGWRLRIFLKNGDLYLVEFSDMDGKEKLERFMRKQYSIVVHEKPLCVKGRNYGDTSFSRNALSFNVEDQLLFEIPLKSVTECEASQNEVTLKFDQGDLPVDGNLGLTEIRLHTPACGSMGADRFKRQVLRDGRADRPNYVAKIIYVRCLTSRSRFDITVHRDYLHLHGQKFNFTIPAEKISNIFLLPYNDANLVAISTKTPVSMGKTSYEFFVFVLGGGKSSCGGFDLPDGHRGGFTLRKTKLDHQNEGTLFASILQQVTGKRFRCPQRIFEISDRAGFRINGNEWDVFFPLDSGLLLVLYRPVFIKNEEVDFIEFVTSANYSTLELFDLKIYTKSDTNSEHICSNMKIDDYEIILDFIKSRKLQYKCIGPKSEVNRKRKVSWSGAQRIVSSESEGDDEDENSCADSGDSFIVSDSEDESVGGEDRPFVLDSSEEASDDQEDASSLSSSSNGEDSSDDSSLSVSNDHRRKKRAGNAKRDEKIRRVRSAKATHVRTDRSRHPKKPRRRRVGRHQRDARGVEFHKNTVFNRYKVPQESSKNCSSGDHVQRRSNSVETNPSKRSRNHQKLRLRLRRSTKVTTNSYPQVSSHCSTEHPVASTSNYNSVGEVRISKTLKIKRVNHSKRVLCSDSSDTSSVISDRESPNGNEQEPETASVNHQNVPESGLAPQGTSPSPRQSGFTGVAGPSNAATGNLGGDKTKPSNMRNSVLDRRRTLSGESQSSHKRLSISSGNKVVTDQIREEPRRLSSRSVSSDKQITAEKSPGSTKSNPSGENIVEVSQSYIRRSSAVDSSEFVVSDKRQKVSESRKSLDKRCSISPVKAPQNKRIMSASADSNVACKQRKVSESSQSLGLGQSVPPDSIPRNTAVSYRRRRSSAKSSGRVSSTNPGIQALLVTLFGSLGENDEQINQGDLPSIRNEGQAAAAFVDSTSTRFRLNEENVIDRIDQGPVECLMVGNLQDAACGSNQNNGPEARNPQNDFSNQVDARLSRSQRKDEPMRLDCRNKSTKELDEYVKRKFTGSKSLYDRSGIHPPSQKSKSSADTVRHIIFDNWYYPTELALIDETKNSTLPLPDQDVSSISSDQLNEMRISAGAGGSGIESETESSRGRNPPPNLPLWIQQSHAATMDVLAESWVDEWFLKHFHPDVGYFSAESAETLFSADILNEVHANESTLDIAESDRNCTCPPPEERSSEQVNYKDDSRARSFNQVSSDLAHTATSEHYFPGAGTSVETQNFGAAYVNLTSEDATDMGDAAGVQSMGSVQRMYEPSDPTGIVADVKYVLIDTMTVDRGTEKSPRKVSADQRRKETNTVRREDSSRAAARTAYYQNETSTQTFKQEKKTPVIKETVSGYQFPGSGPSLTGISAVSKPEKQVVRFIPTPDMNRIFPSRTFTGNPIGIPDQDKIPYIVKTEASTQPPAVQMDSSRVFGNRMVTTSGPVRNDVNKICTGMLSCQDNQKARAFDSPFPLCITVNNSEIAGNTSTAKPPPRKKPLLPTPSQNTSPRTMEMQTHVQPEVQRILKFSEMPSQVSEPRSSGRNIESQMNKHRVDMKIVLPKLLSPPSEYNNNYRSVERQKTMRNGAEKMPVLPGPPHPRFHNSTSEELLEDVLDMEDEAKRLVVLQGHSSPPPDYSPNQRRIEGQITVRDEFETKYNPSDRLPQELAENSGRRIIERRITVRDRPEDKSAVTGVFRKPETASRSSHDKLEEQKAKGISPIKPPSKLNYDRSGRFSFVHERFGRIYFPARLNRNKKRTPVGRDDRGRLVFYPNGPVLSQAFHICAQCRRLGHTTKQCPNGRFTEETKWGSQATATSTQRRYWNHNRYRYFPPEERWYNGNGQPVSRAQASIGPEEQIEPNQHQRFT